VVAGLRNGGEGHTAKTMMQMATAIAESFCARTMIFKLYLELSIYESVVRGHARKLPQE